MPSTTVIKYDELPVRFYDLPETEQQIILRWIRRNLRCRKAPLYTWSSYSIKHLLKRDTGINCQNGEFKGAMLCSGYQPTNPLGINWHFCLSKGSPAFNPDKKVKEENNIDKVYNNHKMKGVFNE